LNEPTEKLPGKGRPTGPAGDTKTSPASRSEDREVDETTANPAAAESAAAADQALREERDQLADQLKRTLADAANMRRRAVKEAEESRRLIVEGFTHELLPVLDNFQLALQSYDEQSEQADPKSFVDGVRMVQSLLTSALERHGLAPIEAEGEAFDPARHEAVAVEARDDVASGQVIRVLQNGYLLGERVLRHAKVVVSGSPPARDDDQSQ